MNHDQQHPIPELIQARVRADYLEQDVSEVFHLLYVLLVWILSRSSGELQQQIRQIVRFKIHQLPQASRVGRRLIEMDAQSGGLLESRGIYLQRWVYEPRK